MSEPTAEGVRQRNLARVLRLVHLEGPLPRATLTETTGLNRSTIADLVGELSSQGLVFAIPWGTLVACLVVAAVVGVLAGAWPAWRASRMRVLDALSYE